MKNLKKKNVVLFVLIIMMLLITACSGTNAETEPVATESVAKDVVIFGDAGWDSIRLHNAIAGFILENGYGYETDVMPGSSVNLNQGLIAGDINVMMEMWQDNVPAYKVSRDKGEVIELGLNFDDNAQGLYVPRYVIEGDSERGIEALAPDLKTVEDLKKYPELFTDPEDPDKAMIVNGPPSWDVTQIIQIKAEKYGLTDQYNIIGSGSSAALGASLSSAYEKGKPWVGYYWEPTWISGKYDLVLLKEPAFDESLWTEEAGYLCEFKSCDVTVAANPEFVANNTDVADFLKQYKTSSALTAEALAYMQDNEAEIDVTAKWFIKENEELWKNWVTEDAHLKIIKAVE